MIEDDKGLATIAKGTQQIFVHVDKVAADTPTVVKLKAITKGGVIATKKI